jgi:solute carrier family 25 thiamine pyrophosphate transporter 19
MSTATSQPTSSSSSSWKSSLAGFASGIVSRMTVAPLDVLKINLQLNSNNVSISSKKINNPKYGSQMIQMLQQIYKNEGIVGLYRGNSFALGLWSTYAAIQFPVYEYCKHKFQFTGHAHSIAGAIAAGTATIATFPLDTYRTRYVYLAARDKPPTTFINPYRGLLPALVVIIPTMALTFSWHEQLERIVGLNSSTSGAIAGAAARTVVFPADTVKRRMMMETITLSESSMGNQHQKQRQTILTIVRNMYVNEGIMSFFKGVMPSVIKSAISTGVTFYVYDYVLLWLK